MKVQGCDCSITIKTTNGEMDVPYSEETIREDVILLQEEASIEGDGISRAIQKKSGITGCIVTPLTLRTAPLLLYLAMGTVGCHFNCTGTRDLYLYELNLLPMEDTDCFSLIQERQGISERRLLEDCRVQGFELRIIRDEAIKLKLDISGERSPSVYPYTDIFSREKGERFNGENVTYRINRKEQNNIYGLTLITKKKANGTKTEVWIKRALVKNDKMENETDFSYINEMTITAKLKRDKYEKRCFGMFHIILNGLFLKSDETIINSADTVIGPLRYFVARDIKMHVFKSGDEAIA